MFIIRLATSIKFYFSNCPNLRALQTCNRANAHLRFGTTSTVLLLRVISNCLIMSARSYGFIFGNILLKYCIILLGPYRMTGEENVV